MFENMIVNSLDDAAGTGNPQKLRFRFQNPHNITIEVTDAPTSSFLNSSRVGVVAFGQQWKEDKINPKPRLWRVLRKFKY